MAKVCGVMLLLLVGCSSTVDSAPPEKPVDVEAFISSVDTQAKALATTLAAQKLTGEQTLETAQAIMAKLNTMEASLSVPEPNGEEVIKSAPESPATANNTANSSQVATPAASSRVTSDGTRLRWNIEGNWNPTILQTSAHLREHGIDTDGMTHQEMADVHASIHEGKPVAAKSETVRYVSRGTNCPNGQCPTSSTRYVRRSRR